MSASHAGRLLLSFLALRAAAGPLEAACRAPDCVRVLGKSSPDGRFRIAFLGEGYGSDRDAFAADVQRMVDGLAADETFAALHDAFVIDRIFTPPSAGDPSPAFGFRHNGRQESCWVDAPPEALERAARAARDAMGTVNAIVVLLAVQGGGGCAFGDLIAIPASQPAHTLLHELGHAAAQLADEYSSHHSLAEARGGLNCAPAGLATAEEPLRGLHWTRFIADPGKLPTSHTASVDPQRSVGRFLGCGRTDTDLVRPVHNCRMKDPFPGFCPVCITLLHNQLDPHIRHSFADLTAADFDGSGAPDLLVHDGDDLTLLALSADRRSYDSIWYGNDRVAPAPGVGEWRPSRMDRYYPADFDGDGKTDLFAFGAPETAPGAGAPTFSLGLLRSRPPGLESVVRYDGVLSGFWALSSGDRFVPGHFVPDRDGVRRADLLIWNPTRQGQSYLGILQSSGTALAGIARFPPLAADWVLQDGDRPQAADWSGDGVDDLVVLRPRADGEPPALALLRSEGSRFVLVKRYEGSVGPWRLRPGDQAIVGRLDEDAAVDLYLVNSIDGPEPRMLALRSTGSDLQPLYRPDAPPAEPGPSFRPALGSPISGLDVDGDGRLDLVALAPAAGGREGIGVLLTRPGEPAATKPRSWPAEYGFGAGVQIVVPRDGRPAGIPLVIHDRERIALLDLSGAPGLRPTLYYKWIDNPLFDRLPWSDVLQ